MYDTLNYITKNDGEISIVFIHGSSLSSNNFINQFSDPLLDSYKLWAIDLPGHGKSPIPAGPEEIYTVKSFAKIVAEFVSDKIDGPVVLVGSSLGGNVAIETAAQLSNVIGLVTCGSAPVACPGDIPKGFMSTSSISYAFLEDLNEDKLQALCLLFTGDVKDYDEMLKADMSNTHKLFRSCLDNSAERGEFEYELKLIRNMRIPMAVIHGGAEKLASYDYICKIPIPTLWRGEVQLIDNSPHLSHLVNPDEFNLLLSDFINERCDIRL